MYHKLFIIMSSFLLINSFTVLFSMDGIDEGQAREWEKNDGLSADEVRVFAKEKMKRIWKEKLLLRREKQLFLAAWDTQAQTWFVSLALSQADCGGSFSEYGYETLRKKSNEQQRSSLDQLQEDPTLNWERPWRAIDSNSDHGFVVRIPSDGSPETSFRLSDGEMSDLKDRYAELARYAELND